MASNSKEIELILGNSNSRFSGVTSTMLQVLEHQKEMIGVAVMGRYHLPEGACSLTFGETAKLCKTPLPSGRWRVFHARRNDEMIQALILKFFYRAKIKIVFTSTAQREHSWITKFLIKKMDGVISTCKAAASYLEKSPDMIIPHGIDTEVYRPAEDKVAAWNELNLPGKYGIGIFGRVRHQKGIDLLVDASLPLLQKYKDFTVVVVGEITSDNEKFVNEQKQKIETAGLSDRFLFKGKQPFSEIPKLFRAMSIVAALSRNEGFGLTVLEAMGSSAAVIATEAGAWKEVVREGVDGYCVPCDDVESLTEKLDLLMSDPTQLDSMGKEGRQRIEEEFTVQREAKALCDYFKTLKERI